MKLIKSILLIIVLSLVTSCSNNMKPEDFKNTEPTLLIEEYFDGKVKAWGILQDRGGKVTRQFKADLIGSFNENIITLDSPPITGGKIRFIPFNKAGYDFSDLSYMDTLCGRGLSSTFIIVE